MLLDVSEQRFEDSIKKDLSHDRTKCCCRKGVALALRVKINLLLGFKPSDVKNQYQNARNALPNVLVPGGYNTSETIGHFCIESEWATPIPCLHTFCRCLHLQ